MPLLNNVHDLANNYFDTAVKHRRHLHANPELSFEEENTAKYIQTVLEENKVSYKANIAGHGIVALIEGKNPASKTIALRGDMDALPITEINEVPYKSTKKGLMHACGHDAHTSSLLGAAHILSKLKNDFEGTVKLIFQPAEEKFPGGASLMIKEGVLKNPTPSGIIGQHVLPELASGLVGFRSGIFMASADEITLIVKGKGGHAAQPHKFIDTILMTSQIIVALQQVVSRRANPNIPTVVSFGHIETDGYYNIIPSTATVLGTFRTMDEKWRFEAHEIIKEIAHQTAASFGGSVEVNINVGYPFLINDETLTNAATEHAKEYMPEGKVVEVDIRMGAEDFSYYTHHTKGCFYRLGTGNEALNTTNGLHTPNFNIDESALKTGMGLMSWLALRALGNG